MFWFIKPLRYLAGALRDLNSPRRIAWGVALGMLVGLVPKDNLTAAALGVVLLTFRINLAAGTCTALICAYLGSYCDPVDGSPGLRRADGPLAGPVLELAVPIAADGLVGPEQHRSSWAI